MAKETSPLHSKFHGAPLDGFEDSVVEDRGWLTHGQQIERMMAAGTLNRGWEKAHFKEAADVPDDFVPANYSPTELEIQDEARLILSGLTRAEARKVLDTGEDPRETETEDPEAPPEASKDTPPAE